ncbi:hypothetical protein ABXS69_09005 [Actinomyces timonensis]|uniref:Rhodanese domain-containing protein n=1 Tax=Actinomyces timonensis TaxID=1288391 RepID=A0AAU8N208_9ACTO
MGAREAGLRGHAAARILLHEGPARDLDGGYRAWSAVGWADPRDDAVAPSMKEE